MHTWQTDLIYWLRPAGDSNEAMLLGHSELPFNQEIRIFIKLLDKEIWSSLPFLRTLPYGAFLYA
jgi:hypothetical protein